MIRVNFIAAGNSYNQKLKTEIRLHKLLMDQEGLITGNENVLLQEQLYKIPL